MWAPAVVVHCNVLAVHLLVHKPADVLGPPVAVEVEVILQGRWEGEQEGEEGGGGGGGRRRRGGRRGSRRWEGEQEGGGSI